MNERTSLLLLTALAACGPDPSTAGTHTTTITATSETTSSGTTGATGGTVPCTAVLMDSDPWDGQTGIYYRSELEVIVSEEGARDVAITLSDDAGALDAVVSWDETDTVATVTPADPLTPESTHHLSVDVCGTVTDIAFSTSVYGTDLNIDVGDLVNRTFYFDMSGAEYTQPEGFGALVGNYLSQPLLVGITAADDDALTLLGAQGQVMDATGELVQDMDYTTMDFGVADFTEAPYFSAITDEFTIEYDGVEIPVYDWQISGTFEPDGTSVGGATGGGLADTRTLGQLMGSMVSDPDDPAAMCDLAASFGFDCETCPDGEPLCMTIAGIFQPASLIDGTLVVVE